MFFNIDGLPLCQDPLTVDIVPPGVADHPLIDGRVVFLEDRSGVAITVVWGSVGTTQELIAELEHIRRQGCIHELCFEDISCHQYVYVNAYMPRLTLNVLGYDDSGAIIYSPLTLTFRQTDPATTFVPLIMGIGAITVMDGIYKMVMPAAGKIVRVEGYIQTLGTGGGQTSIQLRIGLIDYLITVADFVIASGTHLLENQAVDPTLSFIRGEVLELDVDLLPGNTDSSNAQIVVWCEMFRAGRAL